MGNDVQNAIKHVGFASEHGGDGYGKAVEQTVWVHELKMLVDLANEGGLNKARWSCSEKALELADDVVYISQFGSVRSINAGAAAAVSMHAWIMSSSLAGNTGQPP